mmetsp:Transcript_33888/g.89811  ORF Transcript_33888/g.89811 Transcript_33888/m.89811 type:complete len:258 (-) Transcript_33888:367-1140(-)
MRYAIPARSVTRHAASHTGAVAAAARPGTSVVAAAVVAAAVVVAAVVVSPAPPCPPAAVVVVTAAAALLRPVIAGSYTTRVVNFGKRNVRVVLLPWKLTRGYPAGIRAHSPSTFTWSDSSRVAPPPRRMALLDAPCEASKRPLTVTSTSTMSPTCCVWPWLQPHQLQLDSSMFHLMSPARTVQVSFGGPSRPSSLMMYVSTRIWPIVDTGEWKEILSALTPWASPLAFTPSSSWPALRVTASTGSMVNSCAAKVLME